MPDAGPSLPQPIAATLDAFVQEAVSTFGEDLRAIVLYGSAAEGVLRATSDVNLIVVLAAFDAGRADRLREPLRTARAAIGLNVMFLRADEIDAALEAFAVKFADVLRRRKLLWGSDPFAARTLDRGAELLRVRQVLLNLVLRTRQQYMLRSLRDEQMALLVADIAGPLRACAASLLELRGDAVPSPKQALARVARELGDEAFDAALESLSRARESGALPPGTAAAIALELNELAERMHRHAQGVR
jgi:predicted nucleotidyltransferase